MNSTLQRRIMRIGVFALALSLFIAPAFCQNISGSLTGTVKDPAGAVIPARRSQADESKHGRDPDQRD